MSTSVDYAHDLIGSTPVGMRLVVRTHPTRSADTRANIEVAARRLFGAHGYERTTIRQIAAAAKIDPAMIIRYFGNKDELFCLVTEPSLKLGDLSKLDRSTIGEFLMSRFLSIWEDEESADGMPILLRSAASNETAAERLRTIFEKQVVPAVRSIGEADGATFRAGLISSQLLGVALCRYVLKLPPVVDMDRASLVREVGITIQRYATLRSRT